MPRMVLRSLSCRRVEDAFHEHLHITSQQCILLSLSEKQVRLSKEMCWKPKMPAVIIERQSCYGW